MCGIYGILELRAEASPRRVWLDAMGSVTKHRGPDDSGVHIDGELAFGMRRLSIIDLAGGHQPISNEDDTVCLICNGEIYNFAALRAQLLECGHRFKTESDTEVILHAYEEFGSSFLDHIDGMFSFALWDSVKRRLYVARDRMGIKPLYYFRDGRRLAFASELKALLELPFVNRRLDPIALDEYLGLGYVPAPHTMFQGIQKLAPGTLLTAQNGHVDFTHYWRLEHATDSSTQSEWCGRVRTSLNTAVRSQMVSDVPLGAFLSGGIDSSAVVAMMAEHSSLPVKTYSIGFEGSTASNYYNELPYARRVAKLFDTDHREIIVKPNVSQLLPKLLWHLDEPMADTAFITTYLVSEFARQDVTVILSGVGGDELYGGYRRYLGEYYGALYERLPRWLRHKFLAPIAHRLPSDRHSPLLNLSRYARSFVLSHEREFAERYRAYVQVFDRQTRQVLLKGLQGDHPDALQRAFAQAAHGDYLQQLFAVDAATQLPDDLLMLTDKMSMAASLECRVPLLDTQLVEQAARMPAHLKIRGRELKYVLKKAFSDLLPKDILYRKKRGFGAPMGAWIRGDLAHLLRGVLCRENIEKRGLLSWEVIERTMASHEARKEDHTDHLLALMNFELWCQLYLDEVVHSDVAEQLGELAA